MCVLKNKSNLLNNIGPVIKLISKAHPTAATAGEFICIILNIWIAKIWSVSTSIKGSRSGSKMKNRWLSWIKKNHFARILRPYKVRKPDFVVEYIFKAFFRPILWFIQVYMLNLICFRCIYFLNSFWSLSQILMKTLLFSFA